MYFLILALLVFGEMLLVFSLFVLFEKHGNGKQFLRRSIFRTPDHINPYIVVRPSQFY